MYWLKYMYIIISCSVIVDNKQLSIHHFMTVSSVNAYVELGESTSPVKGLVLTLSTVGIFSKTGCVMNNEIRLTYDLP